MKIACPFIYVDIVCSCRNIFKNALFILFKYFDLTFFTCTCIIKITLFISHFIVK